VLSELGTTVVPEEGGLSAGQRVVVAASIENPLAAGRYLVHCGIQSSEGIWLYVEQAAGFVVYGTSSARGILSPRHRFSSRIEGGAPR